MRRNVRKDPTAAAKAATAAATAVVSRRPVGPPTSLNDMLIWVLVGLAAYASFLLFPDRVTGPLHHRTLMSLNDLANAAAHMWKALFMWPLMDYAFRFAAVMLMAPCHASRYAPFMFGPNGLVDDNKTPMERALAAVLRPFRYMATDTTRDFTEQCPESGVKPPEEYPGFWTHREVTVLVAIFALSVICIATYNWHIVPRRRYTEARRRRIDELRASVSQADRDASDDLELVPEPPIVPRLTYVLTWSVLYASAFQWLKAMPVMIGSLYPAVTCVLIAYTMCVP